MKNYLNSLESLANGTCEVLPNLAKSAYENATLPNKKDEHWRFANIDFWANVASELLPKTLDLSGFDSSKLAENEFARRAFFALINGGKFDTFLASKMPSAKIVKVKQNETLTISESEISPISIYILDENSTLNLKCEKTFEASENLSLGSSFFYLGKNATLNFASIYDCNGNAPRYTRADFYLQDGAKLNDVFIDRGASNTRSERNAFILGENADAELAALFISNEKITHDLRTSQINVAPNSRSNLLVKNLLGGNARSAFTGLIRVNESAQKTQSYQSCKSLLMSEGARAQALPILEILANDVACSHGCTVSRPDKEQIFYMKSRGLNDKESQNLIAEGFSAEIFSKAQPLTD